MRAQASLLRILVVDDDPAMRWYVRQCLLPLAREVLEATDSPAALAAARQAVGEGRDLDLVVTDVVMPGPDGNALSEALKAEPLLADVPVLFLTAAARVPQQQRTSVLRKPFNASMLRAKVTTLLNGKLRTARSPRRSQPCG